MSLIQISGHLNRAIDWLSVKLNMGCVLLFMVPQLDTWFKVIGALAGISTLIYNGTRIYKEFKNKEK